MFRGKVRRIHFVGIGGIGMSGIAEVLLNLGFEVSGTDLKRSAVTARLADLGARIAFEHSEGASEGSDVVVVSSAIRPDNAEWRGAVERGIPVIPRAEMLSELMRLKYGIAVAGSHGKTTTTSLVATILSEGGIDPTSVIGGKLNSMGTNARLGEGDYLVAEADESDGSFLSLVPTIGVITNIDPEHLDHWQGGLPQIVDAFVDFANKVPFYGTAVLCMDHPEVQKIMPRVHRRVVTYGLNAQADVGAENVTMHDGQMHFDLRVAGQQQGSITLNMLGEHNVQNALAAIAVALEVGVEIDAARRALETFEGIGRRFETKGHAGDVLVVDDYGHHPEEIRVTLETARRAFERRIVVAFQPHRYTRTRDFFDEFARAFNASDVLFVSDIYAASEDPIEGASAEALVDAIRSQGHHDVRYGGDLNETTNSLRDTLRPGDLLLTLGAGDVWQLGETMLQTLRQ